MFLFFLATVILSPKTIFAQNEKDQKLVEEKIQAYFNGYLTGDLRILYTAFDTTSGGMHRLMPDGKNDTLIHFRDLLPIWSTRAKRTPYSESDLKASRYKILKFEQFRGSLAIVSVDIQFGAKSYIDVLSLYKINGEWKIVSKVFVTNN
ncbi:MAG: nuclear transport factor 2 family protein [Chloroherpetonaceae bacterium]|nr:nuclear transport factor 2 family protein [Chloroherpetonaceae bacterium]